MEESKLYMVMEYMPHSLRNKWVVNRVDLVRTLADVARALARLHAMAGRLERCRARFRARFVWRRVWLPSESLFVEARTLTPTPSASCTSIRRGSHPP